MNFFVAFKNNLLLAFDTIRAHKLRSFLTMLGVIMGTGTIIGVGAILTGFDGAVSGILKSFGPDSIFVLREPAFQTTDLSPEERARKMFVYENVAALREKCAACAYVSAMLSPNNRNPIVTKYKGNAVYQTDVRGVEETFAESGQVDMERGRFFTEFENHHRAAVAVIGADLVKSLFGAEDPIGKLINVDGEQLQVIGTLRRPAASIVDNSDNRVMLPFFTTERIYPNAKDMAITVTAVDKMMSPALDQIRTILRIERRVPVNKPEDFAISTADQMLEQFHQISAVTFLVMIVLSSIGLLVGGIGVMNIMLVSVTERTREIGIRKAIGARRSDIIVQFLLEAVVLTGLGGAMGLVFGWLISLGSRLVFSFLLTSVPVWAAIAGIVMSVAVGLFFGIWPASKAAKLDPVVALRHE